MRYLLTRGQQEVIYRAPLKPSDWGRNIHLGVLYVMNSDALPGSVKHGSRAEWVLSAEQQGVDEVLLCSPEVKFLRQTALLLDFTMEKYAYHQKMANDWPV